QSYFLWTLTQEQLKHCLFPIGDYVKPKVRIIARKFGLPNSDKKDSQGICFLGQVTLKDFLGNYLPEKKGLVLNTAGKVVGEHRGAHFYTIGQRGGLGLGGQKNPVYIAEKDIKENALLVAEENDPALYRHEINLRQINFINKRLITNDKLQVMARVRYRQPLAKATLVESRKSKVEFKLVFDKPQKFVASGQSAVFYEYKRNPSASSGLMMLGGGVID
ncbi:MAG: tRNA 2-thiouridine(34) synthase MnmA, partial [bacterium]|nr:tRNA 2-thiouridine(34) synthase MnmA [bacterium]